jgi:hypothetical protein
MDINSNEARREKMAAGESDEKTKQQQPREKKKSWKR